MNTKSEWAVVGWRRLPDTKGVDWLVDMWQRIQVRREDAVEFMLDRADDPDFLCLPLALFGQPHTSKYAPELSRWMTSAFQCPESIAPVSGYKSGWLQVMSYNVARVGLLTDDAAVMSIEYIGRPCQNVDLIDATSLYVAKELTTQLTTLVATDRRLVAIAPNHLSVDLRKHPQWRGLRMPAGVCQRLYYPLEFIPVAKLSAKSRKALGDHDLEHTVIAWQKQMRELQHQYRSWICKQLEPHGLETLFERWVCWATFPRLQKFCDAVLGRNSWRQWGGWSDIADICRKAPRDKLVDVCKFVSTQEADTAEWIGRMTDAGKLTTVPAPNSPKPLPAVSRRLMEIVK